jgi:hypothetical protein
LRHSLITGQVSSLISARLLSVCNRTAGVTAGSRDSQLLQLGLEYGGSLGGVDLQLLSGQDIAHLEGRLATGARSEVGVLGIQCGTRCRSMKCGNIFEPSGDLPRSP